MKIFLISACLSIGLFTTAYAQTSGSKTLSVSAGDNVTTTLGDHIYRYEGFQSAKIYFRNGRTNTTKLNLNMLLDEMQFVDVQSRDTMSIADPLSIDRIEIGADTYIYVDGYLHIIDTYSDKATLAVNRKMKVVDRQKEGGYGQQTSTSSISSMSSTDNGTNLQYNLKVNENFVVKMEEKFFLIDEKAKVTILNKSNIQRAFPQHKKQIAEYIKINKPNYAKEEDVKALLVYCTTL
jgi:hypothetical protein